MSENQLVKLRLNERDSFVAAWEDAFSRKLNSDIYEWIFNKHNILYALISDGEILAGYCLYPLACIVNKGLEKALLCNNVFVNPRHQGKQLFVKVGKLALKDAASSEEGRIAYGIPNKLALPGHRRVGWDVRPPIAFLEKTRAAKREKPLHNWIKGKINDQLRADIAKCSLDSSKERSFSIIKTEEFVRWRYEEKPNTTYWFGFKYKGDILISYCVCKYFEDGKVLHFIDVDGTDSSAISELIEESQKIPEPFIKSNIWESTAHRELYISMGYKKAEPENALIFIDPATLGPFDLGEKVNIVLGDNDVF